MLHQFYGYSEKERKQERNNQRPKHIGGIQLLFEKQKPEDRKYKMKKHMNGFI